MSETDRAALEEEIEVTSEMIEAGAGAWAMFDAGDRLDWLLASVYRAMSSARAQGADSDGVWFKGSLPPN